MRIDRLKVKHKNFAYCAKGSSTNAAHILFIFSRPMYLTPTDKQRADYERRRKIVEENGGRMARQLHEELGTLRPFSSKDVTNCKRLITRTHKNLRVVSHWNGAGVYSLTVACLRRVDSGNKTP